MAKRQSTANTARISRFSEHDSSSGGGAAGEASVGATSYCPKKGQVLEFLFSKERRQWVKGAVLRVNKTKATFRAQIDIEEDEVFEKQTILQTYFFAECGPVFRPLQRRCAGGKSKGIAKVKKIAGGKDYRQHRQPAAGTRKGSKSKQRGARLEDKEPQDGAAESTQMEPEPMVLLSDEDHAALQAAKQEIKGLLSALAHTNAELVKLDAVERLARACLELSAEHRELESERAALLETDNSRQCTVCWDAVSTVALHPCGHTCVCDQCSGRTTACPLCRTKVTGITRILFSEERENGALPIECLLPAPAAPHSFLRADRKTVLRFSAASESTKTRTGTAGGGGGDLGGVEGCASRSHGVVLTALLHAIRRAAPCGAH